MKAYRTPGGHRRVLGGDLIEFLDRCGMPVPDLLRKRPRRVLVVDDDTALLASLSRALRRLSPNLEVECCSSGIEALIRIGTLQPDVVVLDVFMPGIDGVAVCEKIKADPELPHVKVIAVTGRPSTRVARRVHDAGADAILVKPLRASALLAAIEGDETDASLEPQ